MSLSLAFLEKVALVLRLPMSMIEKKDIHPHHLKQLKGLMRDIHAEFPMS